VSHHPTFRDRAQIPPVLKTFPLPPPLPSPLAHAAHYRLITSTDRRLNVEQIKKHPFFYGVDWNAIRQIDAPFVPRLRSITDTSYFPVEDLEQGGTDDIAGADASDSSKDLAFLGCALHPGSSTLRVDSSSGQIYLQALHHLQWSVAYSSLTWPVLQLVCGGRWPPT
jgi:hypothetical protein